MENNDIKLQRKRQLLPLWIKFFCWIFMFTWILTIIVFIASLFNIQLDLGIYGFEIIKGKIINNLFVYSSFLINGIIAYCLWFERKNAILLAIAGAIWSILVCILSMMYNILILNSVFSFRLEIILLLLYLVKLIKIKDKWLNQAPAGPSRNKFNG